LVLFACYILSKPPEKERLAVIAAGALMEALRVHTLRNYGDTGQTLQNSQSVYFGMAPQDINIYFGFSHGFGIALGLAVTAALWLRRDAAMRPQLIALMLAQVFLIYSMTIVWLVSLRGITFDTELHHFETALGVYVPALFGELFLRWPLFANLSLFAYATLAGAVFGGYLLQQRQREKPPVNLLAVSGIAACASVLYFLVPGCGPLEIFGERFPRDIPFENYTAYTASPAPELWRNAMPSLHTAWALLLAIQLFFFHPSRRIGWAAVVYAALVIAATLGTGAHYFVDLVVALPLTLLVQALASFTLPWAERRLPAIAGAMMMALWLILLCLFPGFFNFYTAWGMIVLTIVISATLLLRLISASRKGPVSDHSILQKQESHGRA
jgi:membrane-associated phospholipid phosphatase